MFASKNLGRVLKWVMSDKKTRSMGQIAKKKKKKKKIHGYALEAKFLSNTHESCTGLKMFHIGSKNTSLDQILGKKIIYSLQVTFSIQYSLTIFRCLL